LFFEFEVWQTLIDVGVHVAPEVDQQGPPLLLLVALLAQNHPFSNLLDDEPIVDHILDLSGVATEHSEDVAHFTETLVGLSRDVLVSLGDVEDGRVEFRGHHQKSIHVSIAL
jgi:hypothetical protein